MTQTVTERAALPVEQITRQSRTNFYYSFLFLPKPKRRAIETVYAFCRLMDDIVDEDLIVDDARQALANWRTEIWHCFHGQPQSTLGRTLKEVVAQFPIKQQHFEDMITGMEMDLDQRRYQNFTELSRYCYHVAGVTGLMCIEIFGYQQPDLPDYAIKLGTALQLVNIMRDLKEDAARGRVYLPQDELARFNYSQAELINSVYNQNFINLMEYQCARARDYFVQARELLTPIDRPNMVAAEIMGQIYFTILERIERARFNVFGEPIKLNKFEKALVAMKTWSRCRKG